MLRFSKASPDNTCIFYIADHFLLYRAGNLFPRTVSKKLYKIASYITVNGRALVYAAPVCKRAANLCKAKYMGRGKDAPAVPVCFVLLRICTVYQSVQFYCPVFCLLLQFCTKTLVFVLHSFLYSNLIIIIKILFSPYLRE